MAKKVKKEIGLAVVGCGTIGRIRTMLARNYPGVNWMGVCDLNETLAKKLAEDSQADFYTTDFKELLKRSEVNAAIIATDENKHVAPTLEAVERGHDMLIEKPLATDVKESLKVFKAISASTVSWQVNALVEATPISGPASVGKAASDSRAIVDVRTFTIEAMRCPPALQ